jgi:hypothetical protein
MLTRFFLSKPSLLLNTVHDTVHNLVQSKSSLLIIAKNFNSKNFHWRYPLVVLKSNLFRKKEKNAKNCQN